jgi:hypothetical protein
VRVLGDRFKPAEQVTSTAPPAPTRGKTRPERGNTQQHPSAGTRPDQSRISATQPAPAAKHGRNAGTQRNYTIYILGYQLPPAGQDQQHRALWHQLAGITCRIRGRHHLQAGRQAGRQQGAAGHHLQQAPGTSWQSVPAAPGVSAAPGVPATPAYQLAECTNKNKCCSKYIVQAKQPPGKPRKIRGANAFFCLPLI